MTQDKKSNMKVTALAIICVILAASTVGALALYIPNQAQIAEKDQTIASLNQQIATLQEQIDSTSSTTAAYSAQIYHAMSKDIDIDKSMSEGTIKNIAEWLKKNVHQYGSSKAPKDILKLATNEEFNPNYYVDYLISKYTKIYDLKD